MFLAASGHALADGTDGRNVPETYTGSGRGGGIGWFRNVERATSMAMSTFGIRVRW